MNDQIDRKNSSSKRIARWFHLVFVWESPNQRLASIVGEGVLIITGTLIMVYWDVFSALFPGLPWLGQLVPWVIPAILGFLTDIVARKLLNRFKAGSRHWPEQEK